MVLAKSMGGLELRPLELDWEVFLGDGASDNLEFDRE
ncbi:hypothetical protein L195_g026944, partial [Trifolium pratense]